MERDQSATCPADLHAADFLQPSTRCERQIRLSRERVTGYAAHSAKFSLVSIAGVLALFLPDAACDVQTAPLLCRSQVFCSSHLWPVWLQSL